MGKTRTPGIAVLANGQRFIDKRYLGVRIGMRVGAVTQEQAEERLRTEMARVECDAARKAHARPTFTDCAARYIEQSRGKRSFDTIKWHVALLQLLVSGVRQPLTTCEHEPANPKRKRSFEPRDYCVVFRLKPT